MIQTNMTNAINTIRENYQSQIEEMVQKEMQRIQNIQVIVDEYIAKYGDNDRTAYRVVCVLNDNLELANDVTMDGYTWFHAYARSMSYSRRERLQRFIFDAFMYADRIEITRKNHLDLIRSTSVAKLETYLKKYLTSSDKAVKVTTNVGHKGFEVVAHLEDGRFFYTTCIGAGGYNIQEYHLRYIAKMRK
jgi:hypothetical protein